MPFTQPPITLLPASAAQPIRSIPDLIDWNTDNNPDELFCVQAVRDGEAMRITFAQLGDAAVRCGERLRSDLRLEEVGDGNGDGMAKGAEKSAPVALFMDSDVGLIVHLFALMGMGVPVC